MGSSSRAADNLKRLHELMQLTPAIMREVLEVADSAYRAREVKLFSDEGAGTDQSDWAALSEPYRRRKERLRPGRKILVWDGDMRRAFATAGGAHVAYWYRIGERFVIKLGATGPFWWEAHQKGVPPMPKRDPQQSGPQLDERMRAAVQRALMPRLQRAGRAFAAALRVRGSGA